MHQRPEVFTSAFKIKGNIISGLVTLLAACGPMVLGGVLFAAALYRPGSGALGRAALLVGIALGIVGLYICNQKVFLVGNAGLRRDLAAALARRTGHNPDDGTAYFVGWAPGKSANFSGGDTDHDVGFLTLTPERMIYLGDTVSFELLRQHVTYVQASQEGVPILADLGLRIAVYWTGQDGVQNAFNLERREGRSRTEVKRNNRELEIILRQWHQSGAVPS